MSTRITLTVNGQKVSGDVEPRTHLADFLREQLRLTSIHLGCEHGVCGACTILIDGEPARSCIALAATLDGADITTLEGMKDDALMQRLKDSFHEEHGLQCGFCTPGMLVSSWDLLQRKGKVDEKTIRCDMSGNLCRCTGYQGIVRSIKAVADTLPEKN
ncbi:(2Fe-2S)-binding protein [Lacisediminimonas sp.]|uniref:(2Fe-2S)-binding protein n=1 Tax=Lacisediminimonas sp. TaxID=3060582 RepID=UPI0027283B06|nr:(2Fe-2S)-binding protein [Lacisediminimonas sp.]MDO8299631.1 (2Fe-2S)-binding protein [Lacisediminimonas sp.]MDO9215957.1 (2Fe-2S)-binding protein [Lacisediminimonas sp.]